MGNDSKDVEITYTCKNCIGTTCRIVQDWIGVDKLINDASVVRVPTMVNVNVCLSPFSEFIPMWFVSSVKCVKGSMTITEALNFANSVNYGRCEPDSATITIPKDSVVHDDNRGDISLHSY